MALLVLGLVLFLGVHSVRVFADSWRSATIARVGALPWKAAYSVLSILGFVLVVYGYGQARMQMPVWDPPAWTKHVTALLMLPVFILFLAAYVPKNALKARRRHPQILSVKLWAFAHLVSNGNLADIVLFGAFLAWSVVDYRAARARDRAANAQPAEASNAMTTLTVVLGLVAYAAFAMWLHAPLIGVRPF
jgi:uncharacterized membrane protein